jgi:hypothetical protein
LLHVRKRQLLQLNVVSALGQLARDQQATAEALLEPKGAANVLLLQERCKVLLRLLPCSCI